MVTVRYFGRLRALAGKKEEALEAATLRGLLREVGVRHGAQARREARKCHILIDGKNAGITGGFSQRLTDGAVVQFLPVCGGG